MIDIHPSLAYSAQALCNKNKIGSHTLANTKTPFLVTILGPNMDRFRIYEQ